MRDFREDFATQWRVVGALLIREIYTRFGREGLGFGWIVARTSGLRDSGLVAFGRRSGLRTNTVCH